MLPTCPAPPQKRLNHTKLNQPPGLHAACSTSVRRRQQLWPTCWLWWRACAYAPQAQDKEGGEQEGVGSPLRRVLSILFRAGGAWSKPLGPAAAPELQPPQPPPDSAAAERAGELQGGDGTEQCMDGSGSAGGGASGRGPGEPPPDHLLEQHGPQRATRDSSISHAADGQGTAEGGAWEEGGGGGGWVGGWLEGAGGASEGLPAPFVHAPHATGLVAQAALESHKAERAWCVPSGAAVATGLDGVGEPGVDARVWRGKGTRASLRMRAPQPRPPVMGLAAQAGVVLASGPEAQARMLLIKVGACACKQVLGGCGVREYPYACVCECVLCVHVFFCVRYLINICAMAKGGGGG